jgi:hypothetical protein
MNPLFLCASCGHAVPMDQTGPTFGLCAHCEASLSNRSSSWTANHRIQQGDANQFQELQQRQPAPPIVPEKQSGTAGTGKRKPRNRAEILRRGEKTLRGYGAAKHLSNQGGDDFLDT